MLTFDSTTIGELAAFADKVSWANGLMAAFTGERTLLVKRATSGDPWVGTTVYQATLGGDMVYGAGKLTVGDVTGIATRLAFDLATGVTAWRITSASGRTMEGTLGLSASGADATLRRSPSGRYSITPKTFRITAPGALAPAPDVLLTTRVITNNTGTPIPAGTVLRTFGQPFGLGQIPEGSEPTFFANGIECPTTLYNQAYWPDSSMRFCGVLLRTSAVIPANGTLSITARSGRVEAAKTSTRTLAELTAVDAKEEITGVTRLTGTWTASLNQAITDNADIALVGAGPAGSIWRIGGFFRDSSNVASARLYAHHYVMGLTNSAGGFAGMRHMIRNMQPFVDPADGTAGASSVDFTAVLKRGATTSRVIQGYNAEQYATAVLSNVMRLDYGNSSHFTATTEGQYDYIAGSGSQAAEAAVLIGFDRPYLYRAHAVPPYPLGGSASTVTTDTNYYPFGFGHMNPAMGSTGDNQGIGVWPQWNINHLMNPIAGNEKAVRVNALSLSEIISCWRKRTTLRPIAVTDPSPSYVGLGAIETNWRAGYSWPISPSPVGGYIMGDTAHQPNPLEWAYIFSGEPQYIDLMLENAGGYQLGGHPSTNIRAIAAPITSVHLQFGERNLQVGIGGPIFKGAGYTMMVGGGVRNAAWVLRSAGAAAAWSPRDMTDGCEHAKYIRECVREIFAGVRYYNKAMPGQWSDHGMWASSQNKETADAIESPWMTNYLQAATAHVAWVSGSADALDLVQHFTRYFVVSHSIRDLGNMAAYRSYQMNDNGELLLSQQNMVWRAGHNVQWNVATKRATLTVSAAGGGTFMANLVNGDILAYTGNLTAGTPATFPGLKGWQRLYMVNVNNTDHSFQLSETAGGAALTPADAHTWDGFFANFTNPGSGVFLAPRYYWTYPEEMRGAISYLAQFAKAGDPILAVKAAMEAKVIATATDDINATSKYAFNGAIV